MRNEVVLRFCIWGFTEISHDEITLAMGIKPSKIYVKGERKNPKFAALAEDNGWLLEPPCDKYTSFEIQLNSLLKIIQSKFEVIKKYCEKYTCEISCAVFIYYDNQESTPSISLGSEYNKIIRDLNLEFDVDIYCLPN
ncbi:MAG: DUF4279 domain-containing protein [Saprospiraceae bacterium]